MSFTRHLLTAATLALALTSTAHADAQEKKTITVGISVGTTEKIFDVVKQVAAREGLEIKLVKFNDYQLPNASSTPATSTPMPSSTSRSSTTRSRRAASTSFPSA